MKLLFWIGIVFTLVVPILIGKFFSDHSISWVAALCGAFVVLMSKFEILQELSLGPLKAKMREQLREAAATIEQLRKIAAVTSEATLTDLMAGSFMGSMTLKKRLELNDKIIESLKEIGATEEQIKKVELDWRKGISIIYHRTIQHVVEQRKDPNQINPNAPEAAKKAGHEIQELLDFEKWAVPTPHQIKIVLERHKIKSPEVEEWVSDYDHFLKTNEIRNKERFVQQ